MKDIHTKERFIELRGQGLSLAAIAAEIGVSKPTLINWERDLKERIDNVQAVELEAMYDKCCLSVRKRVEFFGKRSVGFGASSKSGTSQQSRRKNCLRCTRTSTERPSTRCQSLRFAMTMRSG
jgi:transcriptional regulator with XRE-family HTH domain